MSQSILIRANKPIQKPSLPRRSAGNAGELPKALRSTSNGLFESLVKSSSLSASPAPTDAGAVAVEKEPDGDARTMPPEAPSPAVLTCLLTHENAAQARAESKKPFGPQIITSGPSGPVVISQQLGAQLAPAAASTTQIAAAASTQGNTHGSAQSMTPLEAAHLYRQKVEQEVRQAFAQEQQKNYAKQKNALSSQLSSVQNEFMQLRNEIAKLENTLEQRRSQLTFKTGELNTLQKMFQTLTQNEAAAAQAAAKQAEQTKASTAV